MSKDGSINWMYEGAKSNVHREDYLLGKKVDKNFEKYSDVVNVQKAEAIDTIVNTRTLYDTGSSTGLKTTSLQKDIIKSEDPFVAVKVREETKRRELMDNPLMKMRLQNMLKTMMSSKNEKKKEKKSKKDKKKKKKRSRSSSESSTDSSEERTKKKIKKERSPSPKRKRSEHGEEVRSSRRRDSSSSRRKDDRMSRRSRSRSVEKEKSIRKKSRSPRRERSRSVEGKRIKSRSPRKQRERSRSDDRPRRSSRSPKRHRSKSPERTRRSPRRPIRQKSRSRSRSGENPSTSNSKSSRQFDSHIPQHLQKGGNDSRSDSDSDSGVAAHRKRQNSEKEEPKSYGLVEMRKRTIEEREEAARLPTKEYKLVKLPTGRGSNNKREPRRTLTDEEKAARLAEMQDNVKWRDDVRSKNMERTRAEDREEKDETDKNGYAPSFIRNQMREACDDMTVEKRLQSRKGGVQRSHGYMDRSFARK